jgi:processive 1,2-diacylglycerol beta-glucosyltransferase
MRILIATVTAGGGHLAAAAALQEAWKALRPEDSVETWDLMQFFSTVHRNLYTRGYVQLVEHAPELWGMVFKTTDRPGLAQRLARVRRLFASRSRQKFARKLATYAPDAVLCTHYLPLETLARRENGKPFVASIVTDFEAHALWMEACVDLYCVAHRVTGNRLMARGVPRWQIAATGIPIAARFSRPVDEPGVRRALGLRDDLPLILVLSGGFGMGPVAEILQAMDAAEGEFQTLVVTGRNEDLRRELATQDRLHPCRVLGFASNMHELMAISSLIVTKPGGLTTSEALAKGKPLLIVNPIPGQEAANSDFLLEEGAGVKINRVEDLAYRLPELLNSRKLAALAKSARALGCPEAAASVCREVLGRMSP